MKPCLLRSRASLDPLTTITSSGRIPARIHAQAGRRARVPPRSRDECSRRHQSSVAAAVKAAQSYLGRGPVESELPGGVKIDPFRTVAKELKFLTKNMRQLVGSGHPVLETVSKYYSQSEGKYIRPMLVLLMSQATASMRGPASQSSPSHASPPSTIDEPLSPSDILADVNPSMPPSLFNTSSTTTTTSATDSTAPSASSSSSSSSNNTTDQDILPTQRRLAEITELIHTASLLHDDVIDNSEMRRSNPSANIAFGNKMAVLAGDFLLGRASVALARLRNSEVTELLATVIANLIEGEFMQLKNTLHDETRPQFSQQTVEYYLQKTYLKSASLISKSCRAAAILGNSAPEIVEAAYSYGRNLGLAFQMVDDMLDYQSSEADLGKPAGADLELGLATAPLLFAWRQNPELGALVGRKFSGKDDVLRARQLVLHSDGLEETRALAQEYADRAAKAIAGFPDSEAKRGLEDMCVKVMKRRK